MTATIRGRLPRLHAKEAAQEMARIALQADYSSAGDSEITLDGVYVNDADYTAPNANALTIAKDGRYHVHGSVTTTQDGTLATYNSAWLRVSGTAYDENPIYVHAIGAATPVVLRVHRVHYLGELFAGDILTLSIDTAGATVTIKGGGVRTHLELVYLGPIPA